MSFCETVEEVQCFEKLRTKFPNSPVFMLDLMSWVFINKPDRFEQIMKEHQNNMDEVMIELKDFDYRTIMKNPTE